MENQTENSVSAVEKTDKQHYQTSDPNAALPSNTPAAFAERKWQFASLLTGTLLIASVAVIGWLYMKTTAAGTLRGRLEIENQSLREQLNLAGTQIAGLKNELETLLNRNTAIAIENPNSKLQTASSAVAASRPSTASRQSASADASRINVTSKGTNSSGTTREELIGALGEPDRIYKSRGYEQLVYFGKKPGRFWLIGERVVQVGG